MIVPAIGIVVKDHHSGVFPVRLLHQQVDQSDDVGLLVQWVGVACVPVLIGHRLDKAHGRDVPRLLDHCRKVLEIIHVIGGAVVTYFEGRRRARMHRLAVDGKY